MNILLTKLSFPITDPIINFSIILIIFFITPLLARKIHLPSIIILILSGLIIGPHGFHIIDDTQYLQVFATIGLLYLMFLTGMEIDFKDFKRNRKNSILFGILSFIIPYLAGIFMGFVVFKTDVFGTLLLASMLASHTLVTYPIVSQYGLTRIPVTTIVIGGTIIADTLALISLAVVSDTYSGNITMFFWLKMILHFVVFFTIVIIVFPMIGKWFFSHHDGNGSIQYIFVMGMLFLAASVAELLKIEPIIGAFFAGLSLNRKIVRTSALMNRISFIGDTIFIPFFLLSVGMLVDLQVLFSSWQTTLLVALLVVVAIVSKFIPAYTIQKIMGAGKNERNFIFSLSNARAASAVAIMLVGYNAGMVSDFLLNITIIVILITCLISSFITDRSSSLIARKIEDETPEKKDLERILVPIANPQTMEQLINFAILIKDKSSEEPIYPLTIVPDNHKSEEIIQRNHKILQSAKLHASATGTRLEPLTRIDLNVSDGIARTVREQIINKLVIGWHDKSMTNDFFFSTILENILRKTSKMVFVVKMASAIPLIERMCVVIPPAAEFELGYREWIKTVLSLSRKINSHVIFYGLKDSLKKTKEVVSDYVKNPDHEFVECYSTDMLPVISEKINKHDQLIVIKARKRTVSYNKHIEHMPRQLSKLFSENNILIIYPEQDTSGNQDML